MSKRYKIENISKRKIKKKKKLIITWDGKIMRKKLNYFARVKIAKIINEIDIST